MGFLYICFADQFQPAFHGVGVLKSADSFTYIDDLIEYQIRVYNPSDHDLYSINVTDPMLGLNDTIPFMAATNTTGLTYTFYREVFESDPNPLINEVYVEAVDSEGACSSSSTQAITIITERLIDILKTGPNSAHQGEMITYTITVGSICGVDLFDVVVEDEMLGFSWEGDLSEGESNVFNLTYRVPCDAEDALTNTATVWCESNETTIYAEASWTTEILSPCIPPHSMGYWKNHPEEWPVEEVEIGNVTYIQEEALVILKEANAKDATRMLAAQLVASKLNKASNTYSTLCYCNETVEIAEVISNADSFLSEHPSVLTLKMIKGSCCATKGHIGCLQ